MDGDLPVGAWGRSEPWGYNLVAAKKEEPGWCLTARKLFDGMPPKPQERLANKAIFLCEQYIATVSIIEATLVSSNRCPLSLITMAIIPEEFFVESLMESIPPSPSAFVDLPRSHVCDGEDQLTMDDSVLLHISRVLMEDDIEDNIMYSDHHALLKVQRPFAEILFSDSFRTNNDTSETHASVPLFVTDRGNKGLGNGLLLCNNDHSKLNLDLSKGVDAVGAFFKGMEEASRLLPNNSGFTRGELVGKSGSESITHNVLKKRYNSDKHLEDEVGRARKSVSYSRMKEMEEICKLFDDLMLRSSEACIRDTKKLRITMDNKILKHANKVATDTVDLRALLILCAQAIATGNHASAGELLKRIKQRKGGCNTAVGTWAPLLRQLGNREGGPPEVRITCIAWEAVGIDDLNTNADEVLVVNDLFNLSTLMDESIFLDNPSPKEMVLNNIRKMCPDVFIQSIVNCSSGTSFLTRFREALFYFTALFDMLDATIPRESESHLVLEQGLFGRCALNVIACEGQDLMDRPEKYRQWQVRNKRAGLRQLPLKPNIVQLVRDNVMKFHHKDFLLGEDDQWSHHTTLPLWPPTPEELFAESLREQVPPSPSLSLNHPQMPDCDREGQLSTVDLVLPYISRVLMEDNIDDDLLYQYSDHPALLQVQKPFAQILFSSSFSTSDNNEGTMASVPLHDGDRGNRNVASDLLLCNRDQSSINSESFNGIEEASRLLPKYSSCRGDQLVDDLSWESSTNGRLKKRYNRDNYLEDEGERARKTVTTTNDMEETRVIFDDIMLHDHEACFRDTSKLHMVMTSENVKSNRKRGDKQELHKVDLRMLLILCVQAISTGDQVGSIDLLKQIKQHASKTGDATERLAQCFAQGLEARLAGTGSLIYKSLMEKSPSVLEFLRAHRLYMEACCINQVALVFNSTTIVHAMEGKKRLHIVEFGTNFGLEWPYFFHRLANWEGDPPEVRLTSIRCPKIRSFPTEGIEETGCRLTNCARKLGIPFRFHAITTDWEAVCIEDLDTNPDEVLVVCDNFNLSTLMDESVYFDNASPKDRVLGKIREMRPKVFIQSIVNCSSGTSFLTRFREALFYFTGLFDMLDATTPRDSEPRMVLEQGLLGRCALNIIACEGMDLMDRPEKYRQWKLRNQRAGLRQLPLKPDIIPVLRDKVMNLHHKDFYLGEDDEWLIQGWMGRVLTAHSAWVAKEVPSSV
ncbi:hypothetical protein EJB05_28099 [Eragrostis curvula]|uniref:GRAS family transcription factor n=1 Tax=Eragrostis curvula TaxID=38414 RepID=A0A5J9UQX9_9POAL|nr:hypothetical protein EJB05_28099 [Eragrostis curvula]